MMNKLLACFVLIVASVTSVRVAAQAPAERYRNELQPLIEDFAHQRANFKQPRAALRLDRHRGFDLR